MLHGVDLESCVRDLVYLLRELSKRRMSAAEKKVWVTELRLVVDSHTRRLGYDTFVSALNARGGVSIAAVPF